MSQPPIFNNKDFAANSVFEPHRPVLSFALATNRIAVAEGDFETGEEDGALASLAMLRAAAGAWRAIAGGAQGRAE